MNGNNLNNSSIGADRTRPNTNGLSVDRPLLRALLILHRYLTFVTLALAVVGGVQEANGQITGHFYGEQNLNPTIQHHNLNGGRVHWDYYGSGDANGDGTINNADYVVMQQGVSNDRTDLNGDGVTNSADLGLLNNFLNGQIKYLPAHWDLLQTRMERESWLEKVKIIDKTDTNVYVTGTYECGEFTTQTIVNFDGVENIGPSIYNPNLINFTENGRFNIPTYYVLTKSLGGINHAIYTVFVGDSISKFEDWYFVEPQSDDKIFPGSNPMHPNSFANIKKDLYLYSPILQTRMHGNLQVINFDLNNGNGTVVNSWVGVPTRTLVPLEPSNEAIPNDTIISLGQATDTSNTGYVSNISPGADVFYNDSIVDFGNGNSEIHRKFSWKPFHHYIDSNAPTTLLKEHPWYWLNVDSLGTQIIQVIDDQAPIVSVTSPVYSVPFGSQVPSPQFNISDNSGLAVNVNYVGDSTTQQSNGCGKFNYEQWLKYEFSDPAGNVTNKTFKNAEIYKPNESLQFVHIPQDTIAWMKWDQPNLEDLENSVKAEDVLYPENNLVYNYTMAPQSSSGNLQKYDISVEVSGECGCSRDTSFVAIHDLVNSTNNLENKLKMNLYPNPTTGIINLEGRLDGYTQLYWELFDIQGGKIYRGREALNGRSKLQMDLRDFGPGLVLLKLYDDAKVIKSERILIL